MRHQWYWPSDAAMSVSLSSGAFPLGQQEGTGVHESRWIQHVLDAPQQLYRAGTKLTLLGRVKQQTSSSVSQAEGHNR